MKESQSGTFSKSLTTTHFLDYFKAVNNPDDPFYQADEDILEFNERFVNSENEMLFAELDRNITDAEIRKSIKQLKTGKSGGPDKLINEFLIYGSDALVPYLQKLFNLLFDIGIFQIVGLRVI